MSEKRLMNILSDIPLRLDLDRMITELRLSDRKRLADEFLNLAAEGKTLAHPKALFLDFETTVSGERSIRIGETVFECRVLRINLEEQRRAFPALATCGRELGEWAAGQDNILHQFWAKALADEVLVSAVTALETAISQRHGTEIISFMTPGSLDDWPLSQQRQLFELFGEGAARIGVSLTDSYLMVPASTLSCLAFESDSRFHSCLLCPRNDCLSRRAAYDESLLTTRYGINSSIADDQQSCLG